MVKGGHAWQRGACLAKGVVCGEGMACIAGEVHGGWHAWQGRGACMAGGGGMCGERRACMAGEKATAADGMHPTGMHSCLLIFLFVRKTYRRISSQHKFFFSQRRQLVRFRNNLLDIDILPLKLG